MYLKEEDILEMEVGERHSGGDFATALNPKRLSVSSRQTIYTNAAALPLALLQVFSCHNLSA
jgi:hypothetical protein